MASRPAITKVARCSMCECQLLNLKLSAHQIYATATNAVDLSETRDNEEKKYENSLAISQT